jgi:hypothetical protein
LAKKKSEEWPLGTFQTVALVCVASTSSYTENRIAQAAYRKTIKHGIDMA